MQSFRKFLTVVLLFLITISAVSCDGLMGDNEETDKLRASGVVEVVEVVIAPEIAGGRVAEVLVDEGDTVKAEDMLIRFENDMMLAQFDQAQAVLFQAQANYQLIAAQPLNEQRQVSISFAQLELLSAQQALQDLIDNADLARAYAQQAVDDAEKALEDLQGTGLQLTIALAHQAVVLAEEELDDAIKDRGKKDYQRASDLTIDEAESNYRLAQKAYEDAEKDFNKYEHWSADNLERAHYLSVMAEAKRVRDRALANWNWMLGEPDEIEISLADVRIIVAEANLADAKKKYEEALDGPAPDDVAVLEAQIDAAKRDYQAHKDGPDPDDLALAQARVENTEANLLLAEATTVQEQLDIAQAQVDAADAALEVIQTQLDKSTVYAPVSGVIMTRNVEPGEVIMTGNAAMTIGQMDNLTITVYISENLYGQIDLNDHGSVYVDSFPGEVFSATVTRIANQAEYTPRNVQTSEDRQTTVYAIDLSVDDPDGKLKPGMPADIVFSP